MFHPRCDGPHGVAATGLGCVALAPAAMAAPGDLPDLQQSAPANSPAATSTTTRSAATTTSAGLRDVRPEPLAIRLQSTLHNTGAGALGLCGYSAGKRLDACVPDDRRRRDVRRCGTRERGERLVPLRDRQPQLGRRVQPLARDGRATLRARPAARGAGRPGRRSPDVLGHRLGHVPERQRVDGLRRRARPRSRATVAVAPGATKITQEGAPDQALIAIPAPARAPSCPTAATRSSPSPTRTGRCTSVGHRLRQRQLHDRRRLRRGGLQQLRREPERDAAVDVPAADDAPGLVNRPGRDSFRSAAPRR